MRKGAWETVKRAIAALACSAMVSSQCLAGLPPSDGPPPPAEVLEPGEIHPILDLFSYDPHISKPPYDNPSPFRFVNGEEVAQISYVDAAGKLYDVQINLTKAHARVLRNGQIVGAGELTQVEVEELRRASITTEKGLHIIETIVVGILVAVIGFTLHVAYDLHTDKRECQRGVIAANRIMGNQAASCARENKKYVVEIAPSFADCGASYAGRCE